MPDVVYGEADRPRRSFGAMSVAVASLAIAGSLAASVILPSMAGLDRDAAASHDVLARINDPVYMSRDVLSQGLSKALGVSSELLFENDIVPEAEQVKYPQLQDNIDRLHAIDDAIGATLSEADLAALDTWFEIGAEQARMGQFTLAELDAMAQNIVTIDAEFQARAETANTFMADHRFTAGDAATMTVTAIQTMAAGGPERIDQDIFGMSDDQVFHKTAIAEIWGGLDTQLASLRDFMEVPDWWGRMSTEDARLDAALKAALAVADNVAMDVLMATGPDDTRLKAAVDNAVAAIGSLSDNTDETPVTDIDEMSL